MDESGFGKIPATEFVDGQGESAVNGETLKFPVADATKAGMHESMLKVIEDSEDVATAVDLEKKKAA